MEGRVQRFQPDDSNPSLPQYFPDEGENSDDEEGNDGENVQLGFAYPKSDQHEKILFEISDWHTWDGGKVGGKPVWLDPLTLPDPAELECTKCHWPMTFLLQIYCPLDEVDEAFHRSLYVYLCQKPECLQAGSVKAIRCQLPRANPFYLFEPDEVFQNGSALSLEPQNALAKDKQVKLCEVCGMRGPHICGQCRSVSYCSRVHQRQDWKAGHKYKCVGRKEDTKAPGKPKGPSNKSLNPALLPEYEIEVAPEEDFLRTTAEDLKLIDRHLMRRRSLEAARPPEESRTPTDIDSDPDMELSQRDLDKAVGFTENKDPITMNFLTRTSRASEQILRYARWGGGDPMWIASENRPISADIPHCERCNGERKFEFQVMPQLLYYLKVEDGQPCIPLNKSVGIHPNDQDKNDPKSIQPPTSILPTDGLDWGTLAVYTCINSCHHNETSYAEEFIWIQPPLR